MVKFPSGVKGLHICIFSLVLVICCIEGVRTGAETLFGSSLTNGDVVGVETKVNSNEVVNPTKINTTMPLDDAELIKNAYCTDLSADCEEIERFCKNAAFHNIMLNHCPKTCNLCNELLIRKHAISPDSSKFSKSDVTSPDYAISSEMLPIALPESSGEITQNHTTTTTTLPTSFPIVSPVQFPNSLASFLSLHQLVGSAERYLPDFDIGDQIYNRAFKQTSKTPICKDYSFDCKSKIRLCLNIFYIRTMKRYCQKTCGYCNVQIAGGSEEDAMIEFEESSFEVEPPTPKPPLISNMVKNKFRSLNSRKAYGRTRGESSSSTCVDSGIDCWERRSLCRHSKYTKLMARLCANTCNLCFA